MLAWCVLGWWLGGCFGGLAWWVLVVVWWVLVGGCSVQLGEYCAVSVYRRLCTHSSLASLPAFFHPPVSLPAFCHSPRFTPCFLSSPPRLQADSKTERLRSEVLAAGGLWRDVGRMPETGERLCWFVGLIGWRWLGGVVCVMVECSATGGEGGGGQLKGQASCPQLKMLLPLLFAHISGCCCRCCLPTSQDVAAATV